MFSPLWEAFLDAFPLSILVLQLPAAAVHAAILDEVMSPVQAGIGAVLAALRAALDSRVYVATARVRRACRRGTV